MWIVGGRLGKRCVTGTEIAVDLVSGNVVETVGAIAAVPEQPSAPSRLEQGKGSPHVGLDEGLRAEDRAIDVGLGGEVDDRVDVVIAEYAMDELTIANITLDQLATLPYLEAVYDRQFAATRVVIFKIRYEGDRS